MQLLVDLITRIRNGVLADKKQLVAPYSKFSSSFLSIMVREGFLLGFREESENGKLYFIISLKNNDGHIKSIREIEALSTPGKKLYVTHKDIIKRKQRYAGMAVFILSTNKGVMPDYEAIALGVGGKLLCRVM